MPKNGSKDTHKPQKPLSLQLPTKTQVFENYFFFDLFGGNKFDSAEKDLNSQNGFFNVEMFMTVKGYTSTKKSYTVFF